MNVKSPLKNSMEAEFIAALQQRYRPSILCFASDEAESDRPDYRDVISAAWGEAIRNCPIEFRLVFPPRPRVIAPLQHDLIELRSEKKNYQEKVYELETTAKIRNIVLDELFMPIYFLPDIPSGILIVTKGKEAPSMPECIPHWIRPLLKNVRKSSIKLATPNIPQVLARWLVGTILPLYDSNVARIESEYERDWTGLRQTISNFLGTREDPVAACVSLKLFADLRVQQGLYQDANNAYKKLIGNLEVPEFVSQVNLCAALSDVLNRSTGLQTLEYLSTSRMYNRKSIEHFILCCLTEFYVRVRAGNLPAKALMSFVYAPRTTFEALINPFLVEQLAMCAQPRHASMFLSFAATGYFKLGAFALGIRCMRNAMDDFHVYQWPFLSQGLNHSMLKILAKTKDDPIETLVDIVSSYTLTIPKDLQAYLSLFKIDSPLPCRFVKCKVTDIYAHGFSNTPIKGLAQEWNQNGERMFGAFYHGQFFDYKHLKKRECCVGEHVFLRLVILMPTATYDLADIQFLIRGTASAEVAPLSIPASRIAFIDMCLTPTSPGKLEIYGISFEWGGCVNFETTFSHAPVKMMVFDEVPKLSMQVLSDINEELVVGQSTAVQLKLKNEWTAPFKSLSLYITGEMPAKLIDPAIEDLCGQYRLPCLGPGEEIEVTVAVHATKVGTLLLDLVLPYWGPNPPPRYEYLELEYHVLSPAALFVQPSLSALQVLAPEGYKAIGFTGPDNDIDKHLITVDDRLAVLNFVSSENKKEATKLPACCLAFVDQDVFTFWYQNERGTVGVPVKKPRTDVAMLLRRQSETDFELEVTNITNTAIVDAMVSIQTQDQTPAFLIIGKSRCKLPLLQPGERVIIKLNLMMFETEFVMPIEFKSPSFSGSYELFFDSKQ